jgi:nucleotide-binding universal stress UspA family protein
MSQGNGRPESSAYASIMVALDLGIEAENRVKLAAQLANRFGSQLIGVGAQGIVEPTYTFEGSIELDPRILEAQVKQATDDLVNAESVFRRAAGIRNKIEWRKSFTPPEAFICEQARAADLIVIGRRGANDPITDSMRVDPGDVIMEVGRPVLVVPPEVTFLQADHIVIGWKDTGEARRAVWDSLSLLTRAQKVAIVAVATDPRGESTADVARHLQRHGVTCDKLIRTGKAKEEDAAEEIIKVATEEHADLIVCGGYGHSRLREWIFGGVTRHLLRSSQFACLMSH